MKLKIEIDCDNASFADNPDEIDYALGQALCKYHELRASWKGQWVISGRALFDSNGNMVGIVELSG